MKYKGIVIADIHIGVIPDDIMYDELSHTLLTHIKNMDTLDFIIICGDYFDRKFYLNDARSLFAYTFMTELLDTCKEKNPDFKMRIVYGTESHESNQYNILSRLNTRYDLKVIRHVDSEELFHDMKVLYVPEEYMNDKSEFYKDYFNDEYDYVFGHGVIREVMKEAATLSDSNKTKRKKVPVFSTAELNQICRGQTYFGHYHINSDINDKVFYVGSFTRWQFGEEERKGFYEINFNSDKHTYDNEFIENTSADIYKTISFGYSSEIFKSIDIMEKKLNQIDSMIESEMFDHVRFEFNIPESCENPEYIMNYVKERYKFNQKVKLNIVNGYIVKKKEKDKESIKDDNDKYDIIFDKNINLEDKVSYFIHVEYNRDLEPERVSNYLYKSLNDIMNMNDESL